MGLYNRYPPSVKIAFKIVQSRYLTTNTDVHMCARQRQRSHTWARAQTATAPMPGR